MEEREKAGSANYVATLTLIAIVVGIGPASVDTILPAIPNIAESIGISTAQTQSLIALYFLGFAMGQLVFGPVADAYGHKFGIYLGLSIYMVATFACAISTTLQDLQLWRVIQGAGAASCPVIGRSMIAVKYSGQRQAQALTIMSIILATAPLVSPTIGGLIISWWQWQTIFYTLLVYSMLCIAMLYFYFSRNNVTEYHCNKNIMRAAYMMASLITKFNTIKCLVIAGSGTAPMFAFIAASPGIYLGKYEISPAQLGIALGVNIIAILLGGSINTALLMKYSYKSILSVSTVALTLSSLSLFLASCITTIPFIAIACFVFIVYMITGVVNPNATALLLNNVRDSAGGISSLYGLMQYMFAALAALTISYIPPNVFSLSTVMLVFSLPASFFSVQYVMERKNA